MARTPTTTVAVFIAIAAVFGILLKRQHGIGSLSAGGRRRSSND
jgi:preprotein translocase subunit SecG